MSDRQFHNLPTEQLLALEVKARDEAPRLQKMIRERFEAESPIKVGRAYRVVSGRHAGRLMLVTSIQCGGWTPHGPATPLFPVAAGVLNSQSRLKGWTSTEQRLAISRLDPSPISAAAYVRHP
jgi:hypothetical protein